MHVWAASIMLVLTFYHCFCSGLAVASQWPPRLAQALKQLLTSTPPSLAETAVSETISLGGSEPDIFRLTQAAENLNVTIHPEVRALSSGSHKEVKIKWRGDREDDSKNVKQVLAILQEHVCGSDAQAVSVPSRDIYNSAQFPSQFSAKRIKLSSTKTDYLIVAKSAASLAAQNPRSIYNEVGHQCVQDILLKALSVELHVAHAGRQAWAGDVAKRLCSIFLSNHTSRYC